MIEVLTGVFAGVVSSLIAGALGYVKNAGKHFNLWIVVVGVFVGLLAVQLGASYFTWQEWLLTVSVLALFEFGGEAVWRKLDLQVKIDRVSFFMGALNVGTVIYIVLFLVALFLWFIPMIGTEFAFYELKDGELVWRWFAENVAQIERDAITAYIIFGFPLMAVFSYYALSRIIEMRAK